MNAMTVCMICGDLLPTGDSGDYHRACLERMWDRPDAPRVPWSKQELVPLTIEGDKTSISGFQPKALVRISEGGELEVPPTGSTHILKPQGQLPQMPENEHLSMRLAELAGLEVPPCGLVRLTDGSLAYIVRRFDRTAESPPGRLAKQDFCQLLDVQPTRMYDEPTERCAGAVKEHADAIQDLPDTLLRLYRLFVAAYWLGNSDLHLKNISLLEDATDPQKYRLSPTYDFLCTAIYGPAHFKMALSIGGRRIAKELRLRHFLDLAQGAFGISVADARTLIESVLANEQAAMELVDRSWLPLKKQKQYRLTLAERTKSLRNEQG